MPAIGHGRRFARAASAAIRSEAAEGGVVAACRHGILDRWHPARRKGLAAGQGDRNSGLRFNQNVRLCKETSEKHPVPVHVGALLCEPVGHLLLTLWVMPVSEVPTVGAQPDALRTRHRNPRFTTTNGMTFQCLTSTRLDGSASFADGPLQRSTQIPRKHAHCLTRPRWPHRGIRTSVRNVGTFSVPSLDRSA